LAAVTVTTTRRLGRAVSVLRGAGVITSIEITLMQIKIVIKSYMNRLEYIDTFHAALARLVRSLGFHSLHDLIQEFRFSFLDLFSFRSVVHFQSLTSLTSSHLRIVV
jgi:hypothetical protein